MTDLPTIPHATVEPAGEGFVAKPLAYTVEAHTDFQQAIKDFSLTQTDWEIYLPHDGPFGPWDAVVFVPSL